MFVNYGLIESKSSRLSSKEIDLRSGVFLDVTPTCSRPWQGLKFWKLRANPFLKSEVSNR